MTLELYKELKNEITSRLDVACELVNSFPKNQMGLVERTEEFKSAKRSFDIVFNQLRVLNKHTSNKIKRELAINKRFKN
jgi:hypothetical protein